MTDDLDQSIALSPLKSAKQALGAAAASAALGALVSFQQSSTVSQTINGVTRTVVTRGANLPGLLGSGVAILLALLAIALALRAKPMDPDAPAEERATLSKARVVPVGFAVAIALFAAWTVVGSLPSTVTTP